MIFNPVNLKDELAHISKSSPVTTNLIDDVNQWLKAQVADEQKALQNFPNHSGIDFEPVNKGLQFDVNEVYGKQHIKELCIRFRLRFLPSELYKGTLPYSAIKAVNEFENTFAQGAKTHYYIVAPAEFFKLQDRFSDPLLFAQLSNGTFYLLDQWGEDFKPYQQAMVYPMRNEKTLGITSIALGALVTLLSIVFSAFSLEDYNIGAWFARQVITFIFSTSLIFVSSIIYGLVTYRDLSEDTWNSRFFN